MFDVKFIFVSFASLYLEFFYIFQHETSVSNFPVHLQKQKRAGPICITLYTSKF